MDLDFSRSDPDFRPNRTQEKVDPDPEKNPDPKHWLNECICEY